MQWKTSTLDIELYASETEIRAASERIRQQVVKLNCIGDEESLIFERQLFRSVELFLRKSPEQKQQYYSDFQQHIRQSLYRARQEFAQAEQIMRLEENLGAPLFSICDAIREKNFDYLDEQGLLKYLSYVEIEAVKIALVEIVEYYASLREIYAFSSEFANSLYFQVERAPNRVAELITDNEIEFDRALALTKNGAFFAARAKIRRGVTKWRNLPMINLQTGNWVKNNINKVIFQSKSNFAKRRANSSNPAECDGVRVCSMIFDR